MFDLQSPQATKLIEEAGDSAAVGMTSLQEWQGTAARAALR